MNNLGSRLLYKKTTNEIIYCQTETLGAKPLTKKVLLNAAHLSQDFYEDYSTLEIPQRMTTFEAKRSFRIVEGSIYSKPRIKLGVSQNPIDVNTEFELTVEILDTLPFDAFSGVNMSINDVEFQVSINNNIGSQTIELESPDKYLIKVIDSNFKPSSILIEGV